MVKYTYDAWGKLLSTTGSLASTIGAYNPFRYRSYCYDTETGLYYLNSRYYDPEIGRFLSPDAIIGANGGIVSHNIYAYCDNIPTMLVDYTGEYGLPFWELLYPGQIHRLVQEDMEERFAAELEHTLPSRGRVDAIIADKYVYEIKPVSYKYPPKLFAGLMQLSSYLYELNMNGGQYVAGSEEPISVKFSKNGYNIEYFEYGHGLILYTFERDKQSSKAKFPAPALVPKKNKNIRFDLSYLPIGRCTDGGGRIASSFSLNSGGLTVAAFGYAVISALGAGYVLQAR